MPKQYKVREGFSFVDDNNLIAGGETISLEADVAEKQMHKLEELESAPAPKQVKGSKAPAAKTADDQAPVGNPAPAVDELPAGAAAVTGDDAQKAD
ncbi:hypothetical protein [Duganella sp. Root336D2]|uniref:hypothetical protein n=1 Tax=Duganella sp. Root336D2 TaxID=1736518 RepID=UPI0006F3FDA0|nr:hypothetical protein [Duganella sp. Root336D2]KQV51353.1 hypothetical protein ASD07_10690 [Duganella sp. Root336D2]